MGVEWQETTELMESETPPGPTQTVGPIHSPTQPPVQHRRALQHAPVWVPYNQLWAI